MPKLKLEPSLVITTLIAVLVTQSWPAVVAFVAASALHYLTSKRDDQLAAIQSQANQLNAEAESAAKKLADQYLITSSMESRLVTVENIIAMSQTRTTF